MIAHVTVTPFDGTWFFWLLLMVVPLVVGIIVMATARDRMDRQLFGGLLTFPGVIVVGAIILGLGLTSASNWDHMHQEAALAGAGYANAVPDGNNQYIAFDDLNYTHVFQFVPLGGDQWAISDLTLTR